MKKIVTPKKKTTTTKSFDNIAFIYANIEGHCGIFTEAKLDKNLLDSLPNGVYHYDIRHDDDGVGEPCTIEKRVFVNRLGTLLTIGEIDLGDGDKPFININEYSIYNDFKIRYNDWIDMNRICIERANSKSSRKEFPRLTDAVCHETKISCPEFDNRKRQEDIKIPDHKIILMIKPNYINAEDYLAMVPGLMYDDSKSVIIIDYETIRVNADNKFISVYANLWVKGWTTLSDPNITQESREVFFGKCNRKEISLIKKAVDKFDNLDMGIETLLGKEYNGHGEDDLEAFEITVSGTDDTSINQLVSALQNFSELLDSNDNPYNTIKKCDLNTLRFNDGYEYHYKHD